MGSCETSDWGVKLLHSHSSTRHSLHANLANVNYTNNHHKNFQFCKWNWTTQKHTSALLSVGLTLDKSSSQKKGMKLDIRITKMVKPLVEYLVEYYYCLFSPCFFPCLWPRKVSEVAALFTKQWSLEKHTNSGVSLYSGGIVSSRSPAFFSFFSLAFAWKKKKNKKKNKNII